ncbi:DUF2178 domain-containing protein [Thermococcus sp. M39]|uniref:DUF2178 domain-containing protein n=1 Tax=unclassified Thermococcus TaxID=2627626 RepID=UPI00143B0D66|nr:MULTISPECIES: DUF2178 domain-containing protein [unclassified Thermococcus]NJE08044.1 DUF2178 domain-containing protein [Thermococcus sp. M39]NJE11537.1 DUF2178 domain-containing protein [Thermococcus sp. LS2]
MNELIVNFLIWTVIVVGFTSIWLYLSKKSGDDEKKKALIPAVIVIITMGYIMGWAISEENSTLAFSTLVIGALMLHLYYSSLRKKGYVLEDERILRIGEISARRTLQVFMIGLAFVVIYLSIAQRKNPTLRDAFILAEALLVAVMLLHIAFRAYYSRVM